jgi:hypothetical protein
MARPTNRGNLYTLSTAPCTGFPLLSQAPESEGENHYSTCSVFRLPVVLRNTTVQAEECNYRYWRVPQIGVFVRTLYSTKRMYLRSFIDTVCEFIRYNPNSFNVCRSSSYYIFVHFKPHLSLLQYEATTWQNNKDNGFFFLIICPTCHPDG